MVIYIALNFLKIVCSTDLRKLYRVPQARSRKEGTIKIELTVLFS